MAKENIEPSRTFQVKKYGSSYIIILDRELRKLLNITAKDVKKELVAIRVENIRKIELFKTLDKFGGEENAEKVS